MSTLLHRTGGGPPFRPVFFRSKGVGDEIIVDLGGPHILFPDVSLEDWREAVFALGWHQHEGSGLTCSYSDIMEMQVSDKYWFCKRIAKQRGDEADAIKKAYRNK